MPTLPLTKQLLLNGLRRGGLGFAWVRRYLKARAGTLWTHRAESRTHQKLSRSYGGSAKIDRNTDRGHSKTIRIQRCPRCGGGPRLAHRESSNIAVRQCGRRYREMDSLKHLRPDEFVRMAGKPTPESQGVVVQRLQGLPCAKTGPDRDHVLSGQGQAITNNEKRTLRGIYRGTTRRRSKHVHCAVSQTGTPMDRRKTLLLMAPGAGVRRNWEDPQGASERRGKGHTQLAKCSWNGAGPGKKRGLPLIWITGFLFCGTSVGWSVNIAHRLSWSKSTSPSRISSGRIRSWGHIDRGNGWALLGNGTFKKRSISPRLPFASFTEMCPYHYEDFR